MTHLERGCVLLAAMLLAAATAQAENTLSENQVRGLAASVRSKSSGA